MHVSTVQQVIVFIYGMGLVLSCQIQDDLSLYYNSLLPFFGGKTLCMCRRATPAHLCICWHPCQPISMFPTAMHGPSHQFHIPNSKPVTLYPRYFSVPLYQSLKFITNSMLNQFIYKRLYTGQTQWLGKSFR